MPLRFFDDPVLTQGMNRDDPSWQLPAGACYDALNMLFDGPSRQRGGSTALVSGSQTAFATSLGFCYSADATPIEELYGVDGKTGTVYVINKTTGASTSLGVPAGIGASVVGRPVRNFGFLTFPLKSLTGTGQRLMSTVAGQVDSTTFTNTANASVTAGNQQVTLTGADVTTNVKVGAVIRLYTATNRSWHRVVSIDTTKLFTVWPVPDWTSAAITAGSLVTYPAIASLGGTCAASFQNRILIGNTNDLASINQSLISDRRIYYSPLPTETWTASGLTYSGASFVVAAIDWPKLNYIDVPGSDPIIAMEPISNGELVILTTKDLVIFQGNLVTQLATTSPTVTFDVYPLGTTNGCLSDLSVHRTPVGIMWAGNEGVFAYWPPLRRNPAKTGIRNLMENKILTYWHSLVNPSAGSFVIHGAAYAREHYIISGTSNGVTWSLACNLRNDQWTRLSGAGTDIFTSVARPSIPQQVYAARWWDQTGAAPSMTNGQTVRVETMFDQYTAGATKTDSDGSAVTLSLTTRTITGDSETQKLFQRATVRAQQSSTTAAVTVTAQSKLDAADISAASVRAIGSLSNTSVLTITNATNANPIVVTTSANHGLQTGDYVDIDGVTGNTNANGRQRITVTGVTTFSIIGGYGGNGAFAGSPTCKKVTETDYLISDLNPGQGASFKFDGAPNNWEYHGLRIAALERAPVMSV